MSQMGKHYEPEFKKIVRIHLEEGRNLKGLAAEHGISKASISIWVKQFREECQTNEETRADYDYMKENLQLKKQMAELQKENDFLKKRRHSLRRKSISGLSIYSAVWVQYGVRWLLKRLNILPNAYYTQCKYDTKRLRIVR